MQSPEPTPIKSPIESPSGPPNEPVSSEKPIQQPPVAVKATTAQIPAPVAQAAPGVPGTPITQAAPIVQAAPVVEATPVVQTAPIVQPTPITPHTPLVHNVQPASFAQTAPIVQPTPIYQPSPFVHNRQPPPFAFVRNAPPAPFIQAPPPQPQYPYYRPTTPPTQISLDRDERLRAQTLRAAGWSLNNIAIELSRQLQRPITRNQIHYACVHRTTPQHHNAGRPSSLSPEEIDRLMRYVSSSQHAKRESWKQLAISAGLNCSGEVVRRVLRSRGFKKSTTRRRPAAAAAAAAAASGDSNNNSNGGEQPA